MFDEYISYFLKLFNGREDAFGEQKFNSSQGKATYFLRRHPIGVREINNHFHGNNTYGFYLLHYDSTVSCAVIDIDIGYKVLEETLIKQGQTARKNLLLIAQQEAMKQYEILKKKGLKCYIEYSGSKGYHVWVFFDVPIPAIYVVKLEDLVITRNNLITDERDRGNKCEFYPKQSIIDKEKLGSLIKYPFGKHQLSGSFSYFVEPYTFKQIIGSLTYAKEIYQKGRVTLAEFESVIGEKVDFDILKKYREKVKNETFLKVQKLNSKYEIVPTEFYTINSAGHREKTNKYPILEKMKNMIEKYKPMYKKDTYYEGDDFEEYVRKLKDSKANIDEYCPLPENIDECPPCIYLAYWRSLHDKSEHEARTILVRFFANKGFSPEDVAGFFRWHINDERDNSHPELVSYYVAYYYGNRYDPKRLESCVSMQEKGYCILNGFKKDRIKEIEDIDEFHNKFKDIKKKFNSITDDIAFGQEYINKEENQEDNLDIMEFRNVYKEEIKDLIKDLEVEEKNIFLNKNVWCERIWHPLSKNGEWKKFKEQMENFDVDNELRKLNEDDTGETESEEDGHLPEYIHEGTIPEVDEKKKEEKKSSMTIQTHPSNDYKKINELTYNAIAEEIKEKLPIINEIHKTTRIGATTSLIINPKRFGLNTILLSPTNNINRDTFSRAVGISKNMYIKREIPDIIYGGVIRDNTNMCLKLYKKINLDLVRKFGISKRDLAVNNFPFLFKDTCRKYNSATGMYDHCKYWNCITIGYPTNESGEISPMLESRVGITKSVNMCKVYHVETVGDNDCLKKEETHFDYKCRKCPHFDQSHEYIVPQFKPVCAYATIMRHLIDDPDFNHINIRIIEPHEFNESIFEHSKDNNVIFLTREDVQELVDNKFIPKMKRYCDDDNKIKEEVTYIPNVMLRNFDTLALTYTKLRALFQSAKNVDDLGGENNASMTIINALKSGFNGIVCDEVSHLVGQSPLQFDIYAEALKIGEVSGKDSYEKVSIFDKISMELSTLETIDVNRRMRTTTTTAVTTTTSTSSNYVLLTELMRYFKENFGFLIDCTIDLEELVKRQGDITDKDDENKKLSGKDIRESLKDGKIEENLSNRIKELQIKQSLDGYEEVNHVKGKKLVKINIFKRNKIRYINTIELMKRIKEIKQKTMELRINGELIPEEIENECKTVIDELKIKSNEIGIINEIPIPFEISLNATTLSFTGYLPRTYVIIGWAKINHNIFRNFIQEYGFVEEREINEKFFELYNYLLQIAYDRDRAFPTIIRVLLLSKEDVFFINSFSTFDYRIKITIQTMPSFEEIVEFVRDVVKLRKTKEYSNFAFCTDATMPLIDMTSIFNMPSVRDDIIIPTKIWKFGDPKETCKRQLIVADSRRFSSSDVYHDKIDYIELDKERKLSKQEERRIMNKNCSYVSEYYDREGKKVKSYYRIDSFLTKFKLFVFINRLVEEYGVNNLFIICPNKSVRHIVSDAMKGYKLNQVFVKWLENSYPKDFKSYLDKGWIVVDKINKYNDGTPCYVFYITQLGSNNNFQYYRGNLTLGVASTCRVMLVITAPSSPLNSFDWLAYYYHSKNIMNENSDKVNGLSLEEMSEGLRRYEIQSAFFQTISRVKDPMGEEPSIVFTWGIPEAEIDDKYKWAVCEECGKTELELYNEQQKSFFDRELKIRSDGIYAVGLKNGSTTITKELCYNCIKILKAKNMKVSEQRRNNILREFKGIEDYIAFKVQVPEFVSVLSSINYSDHHFLNVEENMIKTANRYRKGEKLIPKELIKIKERLKQKTLNNIKSKSIDINDLSEEDINKMLSFTFAEMEFTMNKRYFSSSELLKMIKGTDIQSLDELNMMIYEDKVKRSKIYKIRLKNVEEIISYT